MKVFIENEAGSNLKNLHDEKSLEYQKTIDVARPYPYPYGFILNTTAEDGDNVDAFVITNKALKRGEIVEVEVLGLMEQFEDSWNPMSTKEECDHNVITILKGDENIRMNETVQHNLREFVLHVFDNIQVNKTRVGDFLDKNAAMNYISEQIDSK